MYLGVFFHWLSTAAAAATAREATGWKVFGSISESLRSVPFLLFFRTLEVAESTTGGAFLYGAELCSAFISLRSPKPSLVGFFVSVPNVELADRLHGWIRYYDLNFQATARAVRTLHAARRHGCLLALAIKQLHYNWESSRGAETWYGMFNKKIRAVWPRFKLDCSSEIGWSGAPPASSPFDPKDKLGRRFSDAVWQKRWLERQISAFV